MGWHHDELGNNWSYKKQILKEKYSEGAFDCGLSEESPDFFL